MCAMYVNFQLRMQKNIFLQTFLVYFSFQEGATFTSHELFPFPKTNSNRFKVYSSLWHEKKTFKNNYLYLSWRDEARQKAFEDDLFLFSSGIETFCV